ncbi:MAG: alpha/beta fold hydrolase [Janthinobacterium lividum]
MTIFRTALAFTLLSSLPSNGAGTSHAAATGISIDRVVALQDGRRIALHCAGTGVFNVLLEPGDGGRRAHMAKLFAALSKHYRVCDYDRRNVGRSSAAPIPRKADDLAADPFDALAAAGIRGPLILFGTSMGGLLVRAYAATYAVAGFVTSNQPGTSREWRQEAFAVMTPAQRAEDAAWLAGENNEHIDVNDVSRTIEAAPAPTHSHIIMISTERYQCPAAGTCGPTYGAFVAASQAAAAGLAGCLRVVDGDHDLYVTDLPQVLKAIDDVAAYASAHR